MNMLYDVYVHPSKGSWGVNVSGSVINTAHVVGDRLKSETLAPHKLAAEVGKRVRGGFRKLPRPKYLKVSVLITGEKAGSFSEMHPELNVQGKVVVFSTIGIGEDLTTVFQQWEAELDKTDALQEDIDQWLIDVKGAIQYIVATDRHPALPLLVAQWAIKEGRVLMSHEPAVPQRAPAQVPMEWEEWLMPYFPKKELTRTALEHLGWSVKDMLLGDIPTIQTKPEDKSDWYANTSSFAF